MKKHFLLQMAAAEMTVSMLLLLTAVTQAVVALTHNTLTTGQMQTVSCVWTVAHRYFAPGRPLVVSLPRTTPDVTRSALSDSLPQMDDLQTVNVLLGKLHEGTRWPIELFRPNGDDTSDTPVLHHSYILFVWNEEGGSLNETLENQLDNLKHGTSWNPRGRFLVVATDSSNGPAQLLAAHICSILWQVARIVNVVVLISNQIVYRPLHAVSTTKTPAADRLNLYTWLPFNLGRWGEVHDVILLDEWVFEDNGTFSENANLYPAKVPKDFMGLPFKVAVIGIEANVTITENSTQNGVRTDYISSYLRVEIVKFVCKKMNLTTIFHPPSIEFNIGNYAKEFGELEDGLSDVLTGTVPLIPIVVTSSFDATIPYEINSLEMFVPCPKAIRGTEKLLTIFSLSVWFTTGLVLLLTTGVFWCAGNGPYRSLASCFQNTWSVFVAVSVPQQPTNFNLRLFFFLYVCFCFAISTVFQAFFVSYLVEPKYEKKIETFDELLVSNIVYGDNPSVYYATQTVPYPEFTRLLEHKKHKEDCSDTRKCIERLITKRYISIFSSIYYVTLIAREMGTEGVGRIVCLFDKSLVTVGNILLFKKGNPLLERFNTLMRRYLEAGLLEKCLREGQHQASLRGVGRFEGAPGSVFFAYSVSHIMPAFMVLFVGTIFSSVVFIGELTVNCLCKRKGKNRIRTLGE